MTRSTAAVVIVDHDDSFTFNIVQALRQRGASCQVVSSETADIEFLLGAQGLILSPGPCTPSEAGISLALVQAAAKARVVPPILGICLGHQVIAQALGARLQRSTEPRHGETEPMRHDGRGLHRGLANPLQVARYNSLVVAPESLPDSIEPTGWSPREELMALRHRTLPFTGLQYHPESHLCPAAAPVLGRWLRDLRPR